MLQGSIIFVLVVIGLLALALSLFLLIRRGWFLIWLKASFAMSMMAATFAACLALFDVLSYQQLMAEVPIATVSVFEKQDQHFDLTIAAVDGLEQRFEIYGDQWQLDVRLLTWIGPLAVLGNKPLYRLDRISGRYVSLEQARNAKQSLYELNASSGIDLWQILQQVPFWIDANYGSAVYMPMENGAVYAIHLTTKGMNVRPVNSIAERLLQKNW